MSVSRLGLGLAAIGRPAYITAGRSADLGERRTIEATPSALPAAAGPGLRDGRALLRRGPVVRPGGGVPRGSGGGRARRRGRRIQVGLPLRGRLARRRRRPRDQGPLARGLHAPARRDPGPARRPARRSTTCIRPPSTPACWTTPSCTRPSRPSATPGCGSGCRRPARSRGRPSAGRWASRSAASRCSPRSGHVERPRDVRRHGAGRRGGRRVLGDRQGGGRQRAAHPGRGAG